MKYVLKRNMNTCCGDRSCGLCTEKIEPLKDGPVVIGEWVREVPENEQLIDRAIAECPVGALEVVHA